MITYIYDYIYIYVYIIYICILLFQYYNKIFRIENITNNIY